MEEQNHLQSKIKYSVIMPVFNEEPNLQKLYSRLVKVMDSLGNTFEIIFVALFIQHLILSILTQFYWKNTFQKIQTGKATSTNWLKLT